MSRERRRFTCFQSSPEELRDAAWNRFASISHADLNVGREEYRREIEAINAMESGR